MSTNKTSDWFADLECRIPQKRPLKGYPDTDHHRYYNVNPDTRYWILEAQAALETVLRPGHVCRREWEKVVVAFTPKRSLDNEEVEHLIQLFRTVHGLLKAGRLGSFGDVVRAETQDELLHQADDLLRANQLAAASVTAGGALEAHLRHLIAEHGLTIEGSGSIAAFSSQIRKARSNGMLATFTDEDFSRIAKWAQMRNDAAHDPGNFNRTKEQVHLMIRSIRDLTSRTSVRGRYTQETGDVE
jgi:hypothetical protein